MSENPFLGKSALDLPLQPDISQQIRFTAFQVATNNPCSDALPSHLSIDELRRRRRIQGGDAYLAHPKYYHLEMLIEVEQGHSAIVIPLKHSYRVVYVPNDRLFDVKTESIELEALV